MSILQLHTQERAHTFEMGGVIMSRLWLCSPGATPDMQQQGLCGQNVWEVMGEVRRWGVWDTTAGHAGHDRRDAWDTTGGMRGTQRAGCVGHDRRDAWDTTGGMRGTQRAGPVGRDGQGVMAGPVG